MIDIPYNKNFGKWFINDVLRAIRKYDLICEEESIAVALSGGKDSSTLLYILSYLRKYSDLSFSLSAAHIRIADYDTSQLKNFCRKLNIEYYEDTLNSGNRATIENCYICSRLKRGALSNLLAKHGIYKVAYGHHATDVAETFLMNIVKNAKIAALTPKVEVGGSPLLIIRPMIYLEEKRVKKIHSYFALPVFDLPCPYKEETQRDIYREIISSIDSRNPNVSFVKRVVDALEKSSLEDWK